MKLNEYQEQIETFRLPTADTMYVLLGLIGELGELYGHWAKDFRDEREPDSEHEAKELGDILWFVAALANDLGLSLDEVATKNIDKLKSRKSRGKIKGSGDNR